MFEYDLKKNKVVLISLKNLFWGGSWEFILEGSVHGAVIMNYYMEYLTEQQNKCVMPCVQVEKVYPVKALMLHCCL